MYHAGDMTKFDLGARKYDAIISLFSAIGYCTTKQDVVATLECFRRHLKPGGVIIVDPWVTPQEWLGSNVDMHY